VPVSDESIGLLFDPRHIEENIDVKKKQINGFTRNFLKNIENLPKVDCRLLQVSQMVLVGQGSCYSGIELRELF